MMNKYIQKPIDIFNQQDVTVDFNINILIC